MKKILFCWELGDDYGYLGKALKLAQHFYGNSAEFHVASKNLAAASELDWPNNVRLLQAPVWLKNNPQALRAESICEILFYKGYDSYKHLKIFADAWRVIFNTVDPDIIFFDYSPTALLAASGLDKPKVIISNPYLTPPPGTSAISLVPFAHFNETKAIDIHKWVINVINSVRRDYGASPIQTIGDLFEANATFLSGFRETDYFSTYRSDVNYYGSALIASIGTQQPMWKPGLSEKFLAYLKRRDQRSDKILKILAAMQTRTLCFYSDSKLEDKRDFQDSSVAITDTPLDLTDAYKEVSAIICHGGQGIVNEALCRGIPLILVPTQAEQLFIAEKIKSMGSAIVIDANDSFQEIEAKMKTFFSNPAFRENAKYIAEKVFAVDTKSVLEKFNDLVNNLLTNQQRSF